MEKEKLNGEELTQQLIEQGEDIEGLVRISREFVNDVRALLYIIELKGWYSTTLMDAMDRCCLRANDFECKVNKYSVKQMKRTE